MKRTLLALAVTSALLAYAVTGATAGGPKDSAVGGGKTFFGTHIGFSAHDGPNGPSGHVRTRNLEVPFGEFLGHVTCLVVDGNMATIGYRVEKTETGSTEGQGRLLFVVDNGNPKGGTPVDLARGGNTTTPETCRDEVPDGPLMPLSHGNINVKDATP